MILSWGWAQLCNAYLFLNFIGNQSIEITNISAGKSGKKKTFTTTTILLYSILLCGYYSVSGWKVLYDNVKMQRSLNYLFFNEWIITLNDTSLVLFDYVFWFVT